jgi:folate-binding protein YgfZ
MLGEISVALHFGRPAQEIAALRLQAGLVDLPWRGLIQMTGRDRVRFLHGMCTNDIKKLQPGQGCMAAIVTRQGKMVAELIAYVTENALLLEMDRQNLQPAIDHLTRFLVADDVHLSISTAAVVGLWGPRTRTELGAPDLADFHFVMREDRLLARNRTIGPEGYHLIVPADHPEELPRILDHGIAPAGFEAYEALRIENGFPRWGADMDATLLPMEAALEPVAISYSKGCYIGQEVIQRVKTYSDPPKMLVQLEVPDAAPGQKILKASEEVGVVTSAIPSLALGIVGRDYKSPGTELTVGGRLARVRTLPWQSRIV